MARTVAVAMTTIEWTVVDAAYDAVDSVEWKAPEQMEEALVVAYFVPRRTTTVKNLASYFDLAKKAVRPLQNSLNACLQKTSAMKTRFPREPRVRRRRDVNS